MNLLLTEINFYCFYFDIFFYIHIIKQFDFVITNINFILKIQNFESLQHRIISIIFYKCYVFLFIFINFLNSSN